MIARWVAFRSAVVALACLAGAPVCATEADAVADSDDGLVLFVARMTPSGPPPGFCDPCLQQCPAPPTPPPAPASDEPSELDTICITSASYSWFVADVRQVVSGAPLPDRLYIKMWRHGDGVRLPDGGSELWLIRASPEGDFLSTGDNGRDELRISPWGEPYLLLSPWWAEGEEVRGPGNLPCSVIEVREEVAADDFPGARRSAASLSPYEKERIAKGAASMLRVDANGVSPRYGVSMMRLRAHLASLGELDYDDLRCYDEEWARYLGKPVPVDPDE